MPDPFPALAAQAERPLAEQSPLFRLATAPLAGLYGAVTRARRLAYDGGLAPAERLPGITISVGNLAAGGTGKTPLVLELARMLLAQGARPAILTRGYGSGLPQGGGLVLLGGAVAARRGKAGADRIPDEPRLLSCELPLVPVLVGADRRASARAFGAGPTHWLLDDGFQHRQIARDLDLVLLDAREPFANGALLPRGTLREPPSSLRRATAVLFTRAGGGWPSAAARAQVAALTGGPIGEAGFMTYIPNATIDGAPLPLAGRILVAAGVGRPERLQRAVEAQLGRPISVHFVPDHAAFDREALFRAAQGAEAVLTTAKDYWRDPAVFAACARPVGVLGLEVKGASEFLQALLGQLPSVRS